MPSELITEPQKACLDFHGVKHTGTTTKEEAAKLIDTMEKQRPDSRWYALKHMIRPDLFAKPEGAFGRQQVLLETVAAYERQMHSENEEVRDVAEWALGQLGAVRKEEGVSAEAAVLDKWAKSLVTDVLNGVTESWILLNKPQPEQVDALRNMMFDKFGWEFAGFSPWLMLCTYTNYFPETALKPTVFGIGHAKLPLSGFPTTYNDQLEIENMRYLEDGSNESRPLAVDFRADVVDKSSKTSAN
jgi:hypothetical protein